MNQQEFKGGSDGGDQLCSDYFNPRTSKYE